jgi:hypothetical protein
VKLDGRSKKHFRKGSLCPYKLIFPPKALKDDEIAVKATKLKNVRLYTVDAASYNTTNYVEKELKEGQELLLKNLSSLYLVFQANGTTLGCCDFKVGYELKPKNFPTRATKLGKFFV